MVLGQELHAFPDRIPDLRGQALKGGFITHMAPAVAKEGTGGASAGVMAAAVSRFGLSCLPGFAEPRSYNGRVVEAFLPVSFGLVLYSIYLFDNEGMTSRNWDLLTWVGKAVADHGRPVVVAGDFNMGADLIHSSGWARQLKLVRVPIKDESATCYSSSLESSIDHIFVSAAIAHMFQEAVVLSDAPVSPHRPVVTVWKSRVSLPWLRSLPGSYKIQGDPVRPPRPPPSYAEVGQALSDGGIAAAQGA